MSTNIYILKLTDNKYYVGKTKDVNKRFQEHLSGSGSNWTQLYKPLEILKIIRNISPFEEDKQVKELMSIYGIDNVRGGSYSKIQLSQEEKQTLQKEIWGAYDLCIRCGYDSHFVKDCYAEIDINGNKIDDDMIVWVCEYCDKEYEDEKECNKHEKICKINKQKCCKRCGRQNHNNNNCYATSHIDGYVLNDSDEITDSDDECTTVLDVVENTIKHMNVCFKCGRTGHYSNTCYATKHIKGYYIN